MLRPLKNKVLCDQVKPGSTLQERDGQLINNWYIACLSEELSKEKPLKRWIYDQPLVLFRQSSGRPAALVDRCTHRGAQLSLGKCVKGGIQCPYHGWTFDGEGYVSDIPSEGNGLKKVISKFKEELSFEKGPSSEKELPFEEKRSKKRDKQLKQMSFPVIEQDGAIWVWMGAGLPKTQKPSWRFPHFGVTGWEHYFMVTDFANEVTHLCENFMDVPHTVFVHKGWFRDKSLKKVPMSVVTEEGQVCATYKQPNDSIGFTNWLINPKNEPMKHTDRYIFPNITCVDYGFGSSTAFVINSQCTPVSEGLSRVYTYIAFKVGFYAKALKPLMKFYTRQVIEQDVEIMQNQGENISFFGDKNYRSTPADEIHLAIERLRRLGVKGDDSLFEIETKSEQEFWI